MSLPPIALSLFNSPVSFSQPSPLASALTDPAQQIADEFGLKEINEAQTNLFAKANSLRHEHDRKIVHNQARALARGLLLKLQTMRDLGATAAQLRQAGLDGLRELESTSYKMIQDFERFQTGCMDLENRFSQFDAKAAAPANPLTWAAFSDTSAQSSSAVSPLIGAIGQYLVRPSADQPSVLESVVQKVNRLASVPSVRTQDTNKKNEQPTSPAASSRASSSSVDMETKKTQIAQCIRMEDPEAPGSAAVCIAHHLKDLSEPQQRTLLDFVPNAYVGHAANSVAAPFAAVSMVAKAVTKVIFQGAVSESCSEQHRGDLRGFNQCRREQIDLFAGRDPKFNQTIAKETPKAVKEAVAFLVRVDHRLAALDKEWHEQYRTIPGIIHEGCYGAVDTALMVPWLRVARGVASNAVNVLKIPLRLSPEIAPSPSIARTITLFLRNESGTVKLPEFSKLIRERKFYVELFESIGYDVVKGGKGSHTKMTNRDFPKLPMVIIPKDRELSPGVARNLRRIYEKAINIYQDLPRTKLGSPNPSSLSGKLPKQLKNFMKDEAGSVRIPFAGKLQNLKLLESQQVVQRIYETATRVPKEAQAIPEYIDVQAVMDGTLVPHYGQSSGELLPRALMEDMQEALSCPGITLQPPFFNEKSGNTLVTVLSADNSPIGMLKEFLAIRSATGGFIPEVVSLKLLERQGLLYSSTPEILLTGRYTAQGFGTIKVLNGVEKGVVLYRYVPGETMADMLKNHRLRVPSVEYGRTVGEINRINFDLPVSRSYLEEKIATVQLVALHALLDLQTRGFKTRFSLKELETISQDVIRKPGLAGMTLGDAHHGNFIFRQSPLNETQSTFATTVIDTGSLMHSVNRTGVPKGLPSLDFYQAINHFRMFEEVEAMNGRRLMSSSIDDFVKGYREIYRLPSTPEAERFSELFWEILTLGHYIETRAPEFLIKSRLESLERRFAPTRVNGTTIMRTEPAQ